MWVEFLGILATIFVLISFTQSDAKKIRIINLIGAILFVIYGLMISSMSVWLLNSVLILIQICKLVSTSRNDSKN